MKIRHGEGFRKYGELYERNGDYQNVVDNEIIEVIIYTV